jgi:hypothetical protein
MDVPKLAPASLDLKEIFSLGDDFVSFERDLRFAFLHYYLHLQFRDELRVFYSRDELDSVIDGIISKEEDHERTVKGVVFSYTSKSVQSYLPSSWRPSQTQKFWS